MLQLALVKSTSFKACITRRSNTPLRGWTVRKSCLTLDYRRRDLPIEKIGNFYLSQDLVHGVSSIGIESSVLNSVLEEAKKNYISVFGADCFGFFEEDMNFFEHLNHLEYIWFWGVNLKSIEGIYSLKKLRRMGIFGKLPAIEFSKLPSLETLIWEYKKKDTGISNLTKLKSLYLWHYKPASKSFSELLLHNNIEILSFNWVNPYNLSGLPMLENLKKLEIHQSRNFNSMRGLLDIAPNLEEITVTTSKKLTDLEDLKKVKNLKSARVNGTVLI